MFTTQEVMDGFALMHAREPWARIAIRARSFVASCRVDDRDWYPRFLAFLERVIVDELAAQQPNEGE